MKKNFILLISLFIASGFTETIIDSDLLLYKNNKGIEQPVRNKNDWEIKRTQILEGMQAAMGSLPEKNGLPGFNVIYLDTLTRFKHTRYTILFEVAENEKLYAYLYIPVDQKANEKFPAMIALHGTGEQGKNFLDGETYNRGFARELADRGYVVIAPDYPSMGDSKDYDFKKDRYESGTMKGIFNHIRCVDLLETFSFVDSECIGVIGHSLGGHNAMFLGAFDQRLKVIVASCGWTLMDYYDAGEKSTKYYGHRYAGWAQERYMPLLRTKYNLEVEKFPFDMDEVIAAIAPRPFFSNSPVNDSNFSVKGVKEGIKNISKVYSFFKSKEDLKAVYPVTGHDFPMEVRLEAYLFIDKVIGSK
jgi:dienelactone hydrolase